MKEIKLKLEMLLLFNTIILALLSTVVSDEMYSLIETPNEPPRRVYPINANYNPNSVQHPAGYNQPSYSNRG